MSKEFFVTPEHLKLIKAANIRWEDCEFGAPGIDCKRPYGNSSVYRDIAELLGIDSDDGEFDQSQEDYMQKLHKETETVLEILTSNLSVKCGKYVLESGKWSAQ